MRPRTLQSGKHYQQVEAWYVQRGKHNYYPNRTIREENNYYQFTAACIRTEEMKKRSDEKNYLITGHRDRNY